MITRYALTAIDASGLRTLVLANQGRNHFDTQEQGDHALEMLRANNSADRLGDLCLFPETLAVSAVNCYDHADSDFIHVYLFGLHVLTLTHEGVVA